MSRIHIAAGYIGLLLTANASAELRTYDVDFRYQQEVYEALRNILQIYKGVEALPILPDFSYGSVQLLPTGQIVVDTSAATHAEIEELLELIRTRQTEATPRVTFRYWVVLGTPAAESAGDTRSASPPAALTAVLDELERVHGDLTFRVVGAATLVSESGQVAAIDSEPLSVTQTAYVQGQTASARIGLEYVQSVPTVPAAQAQDAFMQIQRPYEGHLTLDVTLQRGEFLVLGENTVRAVGLDGTLFYIAHWPSE